MLGSPAPGQHETSSTSSQSVSDWFASVVPIFIIAVRQDVQVAKRCCCVKQLTRALLFLPACLLADLSVPAEREPQPADEGGQLQLQLLDADKSEPQPLGLESSFQEYLRWV